MQHTTDRDVTSDKQGDPGCHTGIKSSVLYMKGMAKSGTQSFTTKLAELIVGEGCSLWGGQRVCLVVGSGEVL